MVSIYYVLESGVVRLYCTKCGAKIDIGDKYCTTCGAEIDEKRYEFKTGGKAKTTVNKTKIIIRR